MAQQLVLSAAKGSKRAMTALFDENKNEVFSLCSLLLDDSAKAAQITKEVINSAWNQITVKDIKTDISFGRFLKVEAAKRCGAVIFGKDMKGFKVAKVNTEKQEAAESEFYSGDIDGGMRELNSTLSKIDAHSRFVYLLKTAGNLSFIHIGQVIIQREAAARYFYETAVSEIESILIGLKVTEAASLLEQYSKELALPEAENEACKQGIKSRTRFEMPSKRAIIAIVTAFSVVLLAASAISIWQSLYGGKEFTSGTETTATNGTSSLDKSNNDDAVEKYDGYVPPEIDVAKTYYADIAIKDYGKITVKLEPDDAPMTVANFVDLANDGFYNGLTFHRIIEGFMMQGGDPNGNGTGGPGHTIFGEFTSNGFVNELLHTEGALSMARSGDPNSAGSQFFIIHETSPHLDGDYAVFGYVTEGMDIVNKICTDAKPTDNNGTIPASAQPIIESVTIRNE